MPPLSLVPTEKSPPGRDPALVGGAHRRPRRGGARPLVLALLVLGPLVGLGGCAAGGGAPTSSPTAAVSQVPETTEQVVARAKAKGASEEQLAILAKGTISFAAYEAAVGRTVACMREAGLDVIGDIPTNTRGFMVIPYGFGTGAGMTDEQATELGDACMAKHSQVVEEIYQTQPSSVEAEERLFDKYRAAVVACIRKNGGSISDHPSRADVIDPVDEVLDRTQVDCLKEAGAR